MTDYKKEYQSWKTALAGTADCDALTAMEGNDALIKESFYRHLEFGTAGMRGIMGIGTNRMNIWTVRRCSKGLADYILASGKEKAGVAIAYDSRINSAGFAKEAALVLAAAGICVKLYSTLHSVPQLSFTVRELKCAAGIAITASHNPPEYNGYKVYDSDGGQLFETDADAVTAYIDAVTDIFAIPTLDEAAALKSGLLTYIGEDLDNIYYSNVESLLTDADMIKKYGDNVKLVYTPLHGSGNVPVRRVLADIGIKNVYVVPEQENPDGRFPTVTVPNPEDPAAFTLAKALADEQGADVIIGTDPDCDRLGLTLRDSNGKLVTLGGNTIGCLLLEYVLSRTEIKKGDYVVTTIVSTKLASAIAEHYGVEIYSVLTGFKNIAEQIKRNEVEDKGRFLFGFEESHGYLMGTFVRDKDAVISSMLTAEAACYYASLGMTLYDAVCALSNKYGFYAERVVTKTLAGVEGITKIGAAMDALRGLKLREICDKKVLGVRDYRSHEALNTLTGVVSTLDLPASNVLCFDLEGGRLILRPSGTEPKLKAYCNAVADTEEAAANELNALIEFTQQLIENLTA